MWEPGIRIHFPGGGGNGAPAGGGGGGGPLVALPGFGATGGFALVAGVP